MNSPEDFLKETAREKAGRIWRSVVAKAKERSGAVSFWVVVLLLCLVWTFVAFLPRIALNSGWFRVDAAELERIKAIMPQLGVYGDMFGSINSLFSGLALIGVIYAIRLQRQEMKDQAEANRAAVREKNEVLREQRRIAVLTNAGQLAQFYTALLPTVMGKDAEKERMIRNRLKIYVDLMEKMLGLTMDEFRLDQFTMAEDIKAEGREERGEI